MLTLLRLLMLALVPLLLQGCLQVELFGPLTGATVQITELRSGAVVVDGLVTSDASSAEAEHGEEKWAGFSDRARAALLGLVELPEDRFQDDTYYLVAAFGGLDSDGDGNGRIDGNSPGAARRLRAIMTGAQLKQTLNRVTMLSEAVFRVLEPELSRLSDRDLGQRLDQVAARMVTDIRRDGKSDYADLLRWSNFSMPERYKGPPEFLERLSRGLASNIFADEIVSMDSENAVIWADLRPARPKSLRQQSLAGCAFPIVYGDLCTFLRLPLIGMDNDRPSVDAVMERVLVTHSWMASRFEQFLYEMPEDIFLLFRSATAVVIGSGIRPSYYQPATGALYLDAGYLWLSPDERGVVSTEDDYRLEFSRRVAFIDLYRYVRDGRDISAATFTTDGNGNRRLEDVKLDVASLLFHELAHAADTIRPARIDSFPRFLTPFDNSLETVSDQIMQQWPLQSPELAGMANVLFFGALPTHREATYSAAEIGRLFERDRANDLYSYADQFEDLAMLFEESMMAIHFGLERQVAFTSLPPIGSEDTLSCAQLRVAWGSRGRVADPRILPRARAVVTELLPERNYSLRLERLPAPTAMQVGTDWCNNIRDPGSNAIRLPSQVIAADTQRAIDQRVLYRRKR